MNHTGDIAVTEIALDTRAGIFIEGRAFDQYLLPQPEFETRCDLLPGQAGQREVLAGCAWVDGVAFGLQSQNALQRE